MIRTCGNLSPDKGGSTNEDLNSNSLAHLRGSFALTTFPGSEPRSGRGGDPLELSDVDRQIEALLAELAPRGTNVAGNNGETALAEARDTAAVQYIRVDECVEVTPRHVRLREVELSAQRRQTAASRKARGLAPV